LRVICKALARESVLEDFGDVANRKQNDRLSRSLFASDVTRPERRLFRRGFTECIG